MLRASLAEPAISASVNGNVICTSAEKTTPLGAKRYDGPLPPGAVLVKGWMLIVVSTASAPAGTDTVTLPSPELSEPPAGPIVVSTAGSVAVPKGELEAGAPPPEPPPPPQAQSASSANSIAKRFSKRFVPFMVPPLPKERPTK